MTQGTFPAFSLALIALALGYLLPLAGLTIEDYSHGIDPFMALSAFHHHIPPIIIGFLTMPVGYFLGTSIHNKRRAEKELKRSKKILETVTDGIEEGIMLLSRTYDVEWANKTLLARSGSSLEQTIGKKCHEASFGSGLSCKELGFDCPINSIGNSKSSPLGFTYQSREGEKSPSQDYEVSIYPIHNSQGDITQYVHITRDITQRNRADDLIRRENERFKKIQNNETLGMYTRTLEGHFLSANQRFLDFFEYSSLDDLQTVNINALYVNKEERNMFEERLQREGHIHNMSLNLRGKSGKISSVLVTAEMDHNIIIGFVADIHADDEGIIMTECMVCHKYRDGSEEEDEWIKPGDYLYKNKATIKDPGKDYAISHGICSACLKEHYNFSNSPSGKK